MFRWTLLWEAWWRNVRVEPWLTEAQKCEPAVYGQKVWFVFQKVELICRIHVVLFRTFTWSFIAFFGSSSLYLRSNRTEHNFKLLFWAEWIVTNCNTFCHIYTYCKWVNIKCLGKKIVLLFKILMVSNSKIAHYFLLVQIWIPSSSCKLHYLATLTHQFTGLFWQLMGSFVSGLVSFHEVDSALPVSHSLGFSWTLRKKLMLSSVPTVTEEDISC